MNWIIDILVPLVCAIIGGIITLLGVKWTIKYETKKDFEKRKLELKPVFYRIDPFQQYDENNVSDMFFEATKATGKARKEIWGIFKNTDQSLIKLDSIISENRRYYPLNGYVIDKNMTFQLRIFFESIPKDKKMYLHIKDILGNEYTYEMTFSKKYEEYSIQSLQEVPILNNRKFLK